LSYFSYPFALHRTRHLLAHRRPVRVLVLGPRFVGPVLRSHAIDRLSRELGRWLPHGRFEVTEDDEAVGPAADVFMRLQDDVLNAPPDLVVWQVGTWDAIAGSDPHDLAATLIYAAGWLRGQGVDLVLIDPPFVPQVSNEAIYWPIIGTIGHVADRAHINLLRWYAMLQYWDIANRRGIARRERLAAKQPCMSELLALAIARAVLD
jgi:hypothetical protein